MNKHNTIRGQMIEIISRYHFEKLVKEHKTEHGAKGLSSWTQFVSMLFAHISGQHGLRSIERGMNSQAGILYHLGIPSGGKRIKRSSLSYANNKRSGELFKGVFEKALAEARGMKSPHGFRFKNPLYSIDSTTIDLCPRLFPWADFRKGKAGIKLTVKLEHQGKIPGFAIQTNARQHDSKVIREVPLQAGDIAVFERGYTEYGYFKGLCEQKAWFVTRLKSNAKYRLIKKNEVKTGGGAVSDYQILIPSLSSETVFRNRATAFTFFEDSLRIFCGFAAKNRAIRSNSSELLRNSCGISASIPCALWALCA